MSVSQRGCLYLVGFLVFAFFACFLFPFIVLPSVGTAVSLPVITVPAEYYLKDWPSKDFQFVNTLGGALMTNILVILIALGVRRASKGWTQEVPGRFQGFIELIVGGLWGLTQAQAGNKPKVKNILFPIVASIFLFLFVANWGKLLPGVESVGVLHCAVANEEGTALNGFPIQETGLLGMPYFVLRNDAPLNTGTTATIKSYKQCQTMLGVQHYAEEGYAVTLVDPWLDQAVTHTTAEGETIESLAAIYTEQAAAKASEPLPSEQSGYINTAYEGWKSVTITPDSILALNSDLKAAHGDEDSEHGEITATTPLEAGQTIVIRSELFGEQATTLHNQLYTVAPFVRGVATDLNLTLGLAIFAFLLIQAFGVSELGLNYFQKFINVRAIGEVSKRPLAVIDFVVGIFEIVSEFGKIISLSFRLFGAIFAGTVLYAVILFLVGTTTPVIILALELIVGMAQAGVFAILTLIFSAQAMISHHHDDEHGHEHH